MKKKKINAYALVPKLLKNGVAWLLTIIMLVPMYLIVVTSFKTGADAKTMSFSLPAVWTLRNFPEVIDKGKLFSGFFNSMLYSTTATFITILLASMAAYVFSRRRTKGNKFLYMFIIMGMVLPVNYVALMKVMQFFRLNNSRHGIIMLYIAIQLPFMVFLIYSYVAKIPVELDEAAVIDGCGPFTLFFSIVFPLMKPVLITSFVLCFLNTWNEFVMPLYFLNRTEMWPMTLAVYNFFGRYETNWNLICADVLLTSLPVVTLYLVCQKHIVGGQTVGAVKG